MIKHIKQGIKKSIIIICILFCVFLIWGLWEAFLKDLIPYKRTSFEDYTNFYLEVGDSSFPEEVSFTVSHERYFYYSGNMDKKRAVCFVVETAEEYKEYKNSKSIQNSLREEGYPQAVSKSFLQEGKIVFLEEIMEQDAEKYSVLEYEELKLQHGFYRRGILCNDETQEIIIFSYKDSSIFNDLE